MNTYRTHVDRRRKTVEDHLGVAGHVWTGDGRWEWLCWAGHTGYSLTSFEDAKGALLVHVDTEECQ